MAAFVFLCDLSTERECLDRKLFGSNPGDAYKFHFSKIKAGDTLFLYNLDAGFLRGPFVAKTACLSNIEPTAWKKTRRSFPWQVRVDDTTALKNPVGVDVLQKFLPLSSTRSGLLPPSELDEAQFAKTLDALRQAN